MKKCFLFLLLCALVLTVRAAHQPLPGMIKPNVCRAYEIVHVNGVLTTLESAQANLNTMIVAYGNVHNDHAIRYGLGFNQTVSAFSDFLQAYRQILASYPGVTQTEWLQAIITGQLPASLPREAITDIARIIGQALGMGVAPPHYTDADLDRVQSAITLDDRRSFTGHDYVERRTRTANHPAGRVT